MLFLLVLFIGILTYLVVQRSVAHITRTPVWILWLVMMTPAFVWTAWVLLNGENTPIPLLLLLGPFIACSLLYYVLIQVGRLPQTAADAAKKTENPIAAAPVAENRQLLRPIDKQEEADLQNCFPWTIFYLQNIEYRPQAMICRGQLRTSPEVAYKTVRENVESRFGDRFLIVFQEGLNGKPFFALVPNSQIQTLRSSKVAVKRPFLATGLFLLTLVTTTLAGVVFSGISNEQLQNDISLLWRGVPYALSLITILGLHELAHYLASQVYKIRATFPYFIPVPPMPVFPFGTFGAFIQMRSPIPNRKALFDIGIAGPLAGFLVTLPLVWWGLAHSTPVPIADESSILNFESFQPSASLLLAVLSKLALGGQLAANEALKLHPVAIAGCLGIIVTALNLMPVGQLDGGHIVHAMFGQRVGAVIGQVSRLLILALSFVQQEFFLWAILLFFIPVVDEPALNDVSELDNKRDFLGLVALGLLVMIILPAPSSLIQILF